ncbi:MAG TPA: glycoside hydrolase family 9 protein [Polyangia bacterium]|jgi:endoglucanase|nr:glycoside hydrolase family 9 protein [Polyangia bacterium]
MAAGSTFVVRVVVGSFIALTIAAAPAPARAAESLMSRAPSVPGGVNLLANPGFEAGALRPWSMNFGMPRGGQGDVKGGELCLRVDAPAPRRTDVVLRQSQLAITAGHRYQLRLRMHASAPTRLRARISKVGVPYTEIWSVVAGADTSAATYAATFDAAVDEDDAELVFELGGDLLSTVPVTVCLDDVELNDPRFEPPPERAAAPPSSLRVNQLGYLPRLAKLATLASPATSPVDWQLTNQAGKLVAAGKTRVFGADAAAGEHLHQIDFSTVTAIGTGFRLRAGDDQSPPFEIGSGIYHRLKYDALAFFYLQRSGVPIEMPYAGTPGYVRPPGHPGDRSVACAPEAPCPYRLDVSGGWYDAGDHGKYVVSSAISVWTLHNQYERLARFGASARDFADGTLNIPERHNGRPDLLDEARFNLEFMLAMQVPAGQPLAGMVHHKVHDNRWTPIPQLPDRDTLPRYLRPPTTSATLDLAATAAQAARLWRALDPAFAARCLGAAEIAFAAAQKNPRLLPERETPGGGAYADGDLSDELYWAAAELYLTTGKGAYKAEMDRSRFAPATGGGAAAVSALGMIGWDHVAGLGLLSLALVPNQLPAGEVAALRRAIGASAEQLLGHIRRRGYRMPLVSERVYVWGSNAGVLNGALLLAAAYDLHQNPDYLRGVVDCLDYLLGRNPLAQSYVAGYGTRAMRNPHHRVWAHQKDPTLPEAPPGAVSGGPNSMMQDPYIRKLGKSGCPPQTCYVDNIESYSTNEVAINWNASLAWLAAFMDDLAGRAPVAAARP